MSTVGRVEESSADRWSITGLEKVSLGERLLAGKGEAVAVELLRERVVALPLRGSPAVGDEVRGAGPLAVPTGDALLGRCVDPLGVALDGGPAVIGVPRSIAGSRTGRLEWGRPLPTGLLVLDLARRVHRGAALLVTGSSSASRSVLMDRIAAFRLREGDVVVLAGSAVTPARLAGLRRDGGSTDWIGVGVSRDAPMGARALLPFAAATIADALRDDGRHVLLVVDALPHEPCELWRAWRGSHPASDARRLCGVVGTTREGGSVTLLASTAEGCAPDPAVAEASDGRLRADRLLAGDPSLPPIKNLALPARVDDVASVAGPIAVALLYAQLADERGEEDRSETVRLGRTLRLALRPEPIGCPDPVAQLCALAALIQTSPGADPEWLVHRLQCALAEEERHLVRAVAEGRRLDRATLQRLGELARAIADAAPNRHPPKGPTSMVAPGYVARHARDAGPLADGHFRVVTASAEGLLTHWDHATSLGARAHADDAASEGDPPLTAAYVFDHHQQLLWRGRHR